MAYLGRKGAVAPLTSADIPVGIVEGTDIAFLENASGTQNLGGTYSTERMYLNDSYTLTGDVTITGHLALGTVADSDVVITDDGSTRTITGSGTLETGELIHQRNPDLTGMTGELGSAVTNNAGVASGTIGSGVTGSPAISLDNATAPAFLVQAQAMSNLAYGGYTDVQFVTVIKNIGGGSFGSYTYTAPVSGLYYISANLHYTGFPNNVTDFRVNIVTSNRTYEMRYAKFINAEHSTNYTGTFRNSSLVDLDVNDTCKIQVYQNSGSSAADLATGSYFSGFLVSKY